MAQFLLRNEIHKRGFSNEFGPGPTDKRIVPWGVTDVGKIVYAEKTAPAPDPKTGLKPYTAALGRERRKECESMPAELVPTRTAPALPAVQQTTAGLKAYLKIKRGKADAVAVDGKIDDNIKKYMYSENYGYGRLGSRKEMPATVDLRIGRTLDALENAMLPVVLGIHDTFARKVFLDLGPSDSVDDSPMRRRYDDCGTKVRPTGEGQLFNPKSRGRRERVYDGPLTKEATEALPKDPALAQKAVEKGIGPAPTNDSGILSKPGGGFAELQERIRGVDLYDPVADTEGACRVGS